MRVSHCCGLNRERMRNHDLTTTLQRSTFDLYDTMPYQQKAISSLQNPGKEEWILRQNAHKRKCGFQKGIDSDETLSLQIIN